MRLLKAEMKSVIDSDNLALTVTYINDEDKIVTDEGHYIISTNSYYPAIEAEVSDAAEREYYDLQEAVENR